MKFIGYVEHHVINLDNCTQGQWNHFVMNRWAEEFCAEIAMSKENWEKAEQHIIDSLSKCQYDYLTNNPNGII